MALTHSARCADCGSGQSFSSNPRSECHRPGCARLNLADAFDLPSQALLPDLQDPFTYYNAFLNTATPSGCSKNEFPQRDDDYTRHTELVGAQGPEGQQSRVRAIPYHMAVRMANRSNGAPLATIVEQGSFSTLHSRGSLLSVGRFSSVHLSGTSSPARAASRFHQNLDENTLNQIQMNVMQGYPTAHASEAYTTLQDDGRTHPIVDTSRPMKMAIQELPQCPRSQISEVDYEQDNRQGGFFRGVLRNVRAASQTRSRSSSVTHTPVVEEREGRPEMSDNSPSCQTQGDDHHPRQGKCLGGPGATKSTPNLFSTAPSTPILASQATNRKTPLTNSRSSAPTSTCSPPGQSNLPPFESFTSTEPVSQNLAPSVAWSSREQPSSVRLVPPEPRDVAYLSVTTGASTLSKQCNDSTSAQHTFEGVNVTPDSTSLLHKHDCAQEVSRNVSFCSTMSTSYSGTVLGVDLDLQFSTPESVRDSSSPMPV